MFQMRWAIVPACLTFGPLFFVMGVAGDTQLLIVGALMTIIGLAILLHGLFTRQLPPSSPPSRDHLSGVVFGVGLGCIASAAFLHYLSVEQIMYVGFAIIIVGSFLRPRLEHPHTSSGTV
jgi:hypothetical protein